MKIVAKLSLALLILCVASFLSSCGLEYSDSSETSDSFNTDITDIDNSVNGGDAFDNGNSEECTEARGNDGPGGFLWKPVSEGDGNLVILFPKEFARQFLSVKVERIIETEEVSESGSTTVVTKETELEFGEFDGYFEDGRQIWRFSAPGSEYTGKVIVDDRSQECVWEIDGEPSERND